MKALPKPSRAAPTRMTDLDYQRLANFRYTLRLFLDFSSNAAKEKGLTSQQHQALLAIKGLTLAGQATIADIAKRLVSRHHSTVELINRLSDLGLIRRGVDAADRRKVTIVLTAKAEKTLARLSTAHLDELKRLSPSLQAILESMKQ